MTKQVFDQIAEGLREAAEAPPAWAIEKAREVVALGLERGGCPNIAQCVRDGLVDGKPNLLAIARALAEADKAATERERERCARIADGFHERSVEWAKTVRITVRGSVVGYIAGKFWIAFGERSDPHAFTLANEWLAK